MEINHCDYDFVGAYHDEMTADRKRWWNEQLLPSIPLNSFIAMDNAPYHSRRAEPYPVKSLTKKKYGGMAERKKNFLSSQMLKR